MPVAGDIITVPTVPGSRIATTEAVADSATFTTTETVCLTVVAPLVIGRTYGVWANPGFASTVANDSVRGHLREDTVSGAERDTNVINTDQSTGTTRKSACLLYSEFTATATGNKTFVATGDRVNGTGTCRMEAATNRPSYLYVEYIRG